MMETKTCCIHGDYWTEKCSVCEENRILAQKQPKLEQKESPFCEHCKEADCAISSDGTCELIRRYLKAVDMGVHVCSFGRDNVCLTCGAPFKQRGATMRYGKCPRCGDEIELDATPEYNEESPYERVCYGCGWFDHVRYTTEVDAELAAEDYDKKQPEGEKG